MPPLGFLPVVLFLFMATLGLAPTLSVASDLRSYHNSLQARYAHAHSLGDSYQFNPRDGWETVNVTDMPYKYSRDEDELNEDELDDLVDEDDDDEHEHEHLNALEKRASKKNSTKAVKTAKTTSKSKSKAKPKSKSSSKSKPKAKTSSKSKAASSKSKAPSGVASSLQKVVDSIKGIGKAEPVAITWCAHSVRHPKQRRSFFSSHAGIPAKIY